MKQSGFTLIELMIAMTILAFISMAVYQNTTQSFVLRDNVEQDGDFYNSIRVALDILGRDVIHIYSPNAAALPGDLGKAAKKTAQGTFDVQADPNSGGTNPAPPEPASQFWGESINTVGVRPSRLQGEAEKISFIINSHMRLFRDSAECDFAKIIYALEDDRDQKSNATVKALIKREDPAAFEDNTRQKSETEVRYVLISNVKSLKFRFLDGEKDKWDDKWDTEGMDHKGKFPVVIEITLEVTPPNSQNPLKITQLYRPEFL